MSEEQLIQKSEDQWAIVELMGHAQTAGRVTRPSEWGGLLRVDVPDGESNEFRTEFYGISAIYALRFVSEEIARAYGQRNYAVRSYNEPIVTRADHERVVEDLEAKLSRSERAIGILERRLAVVDALPAPSDELPG